jgi:transcriptional regulator GlxA family with amidase domain
MRLDEAARLLVQTDRPVGRIAAETGFVDPAHFTKSFQRHTGQSPTIYRQIRQMTPSEHE